MDNSQVSEKIQSAVVVIKSKWGLISKILIGLLLIWIVTQGVLTVQRAKDATKIKNENEKLQESLSDMTNELTSTQEQLENTQSELAITQEQLDYAENQVDLLEESTNALVQQVGALEGHITELESELEKLLNVQNAKPKITEQQLEEQLSSLSELVTAKYFYRNATRQDASKTWLWWGWTLPFSDTSLLAAYDGTIKAGIDFSAIQVKVNESKREIVVLLPASKITDNNIPQETINVLEVKDNLFNKVTFNDYNQFIATEKKVMEQRAIDRGILGEAKESAKTTIRTFLNQIPSMDTYTLIVQ